MKKTLRYKTYWLGVFGLFLGLGNPRFRGSHF